MAEPPPARGGTRRWPFTSIIALVGLLIVAVMLTSANDRSFLLEAETFGARLTFHGEANAWNFEEATLCVPRPVPQPRLAARDSAEPAVCSPALFQIRSVRDHAVNWRAGSSVDLLVDTAGALSVRLAQSGQEDLPEGAFIVVPAHVWARHGALTFSGTLRVGDTIASGSRNYLRSGRWEVRQGGIAISLFRDVVEVVKRGEFTLGASVEVFSGDQPATLYGSITPSRNVTAPFSEPAMHLVALSQKGPVELRLGYFGLSGTTIQRPDWIDRITSSSTLVALVAIMTFIATGYQLFLFTRISDIVAADRSVPSARPPAGPPASTEAAEDVAAGTIAPDAGNSTADTDKTPAEA